MPLATTTVNGTITLPDGGGIAIAILTFSLVRLQTVTPYVLPTANKTVQIAANGDFTVELAPNDPAQAPTYLVTLTVYNSSGAQVHFEQLGYIAVPAIGPVELADMLVLDPPESTQADALAQALAAAAAAAGQAVVAQGYAIDAEDSAAEAALYGGILIDDVADVLADTSLFYGTGPGGVSDGDYIRTREEGYNFMVAPVGATDHHFSTAGGVKLYLKSASSRTYYDRGAITSNVSSPGDDTWLMTQFPVGGGHGVTAYGAGALQGALDPDTGAGDVMRVTAFGAGALEKLEQGNRLDAFGQGAMRFTRVGERNVAVGTLAMQWAGGDLSTDPEGRYNYHDLLYNAGTPVTDPTWNPDSLETDNPGLRSRIATELASSPWAAATTDFARNVAVGRDAGVDLLKGTYNTYLGYRAGAWSFIHDYNTFLGADAGRNCVFGAGNTATGFEAASKLQDGDNNTAVGRQAGASTVSGYRQTFVGFRSGWKVSGAGENSVYIGPYSGYHDRTGDHDNRLYIGSGSTAVGQVGLVVGDFANGRIGIGQSLAFSELSTVKGLLLRTGSVVGGVNPNTSANSFVIEHGGGNAGMTIKTDNLSTAFIVFADQDDNNPGLIKYDHTADALTFRSGDADRATITQGLVVGSPTGGDRGTGSINATAVYDDNALLTCYPIEAAVTGSVDVVAWDEVSPNGEHGPARRFASERMDLLDVDAFIAFWKEHKHLPSLPSRDEWVNHATDKRPVGELVQMLCETVDLMAVHISQLRDEIRNLKGRPETWRKE